MGTKSFYGVGQGSFYGGGMYGNGQLPVSFIEKELGPASMISFNDGIENKSLKKCLIDIKLIQEGSGDPSPNNVRPISGWTGMQIIRCGKNLAELHNDTNPDASKYIYSRLNGGNITCVKNISATGFFAKFMFPAVKGTTYRFAFDSYTADGNAKELIMYIYKDELWGENIDRINFKILGTQYNWTALESGLLVIGIYAGSSTAVGTVLKFDGFRIELAAEIDSGYKSYQGDTFTTAFPSEAGTVYGGTLDVTSGVLTVDRASIVFDESNDEGWGKSASYNYFATSKISGALDENASPNNFLSNLYAYGQVANVNQTLGACLIWATVRVRLADMSISLDDWKGVLSDQPMQVVYPLATPQTYQLTPTQITTLLGTNNVWADTGDITIKYLAKK